MALRDQPYFPLYVQDYLTDEKLNSCSASSQGVFIKIMCIFHKSEPYGGILLKQKDKQNLSSSLNFVSAFVTKLSKLLPFETETIRQAVTELIDEKVIEIEGDFLFQKRMVQDNKTSLVRSEAGKKGGGNPGFVKTKSQTTTKNLNKQKHKQNTEYEYEYEIGYENINEIKNETENKKQAHPEYSDCIKIYSDFIKLRTSAPARIDGLIGRSMNEIITQLSKYQAVVDKERTVSDLFQYIFDHFNDWTTFQQTQIKLNQINSNLENIINSIKNGRPKSGKNAGADEIHQLAELQRRGVKIDYASMFDKKGG